MVRIKSTMIGHDSGFNDCSEKSLQRSDMMEALSNGQDRVFNNNRDGRALDRPEKFAYEYAPLCCDKVVERVRQESS